MNNVAKLPVDGHGDDTGTVREPNGACRRQPGDRLVRPIERPRLIVVQSQDALDDKMSVFRILPASAGHPVNGILRPARSEARHRG